MKTLKGPGIFLAQFVGPNAPFDRLDTIAKWAAGNPELLDEFGIAAAESEGHHGHILLLRFGIAIFGKPCQCRRAVLHHPLIERSEGRDAAEFAFEFGCTFDFYFCDGTTLKTIERANPSIVILKKGTITQKVHYHDASLLKF